MNLEFNDRKEMDLKNRIDKDDFYLFYFVSFCLVVSFDFD